MTLKLLKKKIHQNQEREKKNLQNQNLVVKYKVNSNNRNNKNKKNLKQVQLVKNQLIMILKKNSLNLEELQDVEMEIK